MSDTTKKGEQREGGKLQEVVSVADHVNQHDLKTLVAIIINAEQSLINNRMTWMITFQGFLFASFALTASIIDNPNVKTIIIDVVPYTGLLVAIITIYGIEAAFIAITKTKIDFNKLKKSKVNSETMLNPYGDMFATLLGRIVAYSFPIIIAITWLIIAGRSHRVEVENEKNNDKKNILIDNMVTSDSVNRNIINKDLIIINSDKIKAKQK